MKFLILLLIVVGVIYLFRQRSRNLSHQHHTHTKKQTTIAMVQCEHCGIHLPENEAIMRQGHVWCCPEHERQGKKV